MLSQVYRGFASSVEPWQLHGDGGHIGGQLSIDLASTTCLPMIIIMASTMHYHGFLLKKVNNANLYEFQSETINRSISILTAKIRRKKPAVKVVSTTSAYQIPGMEPPLLSRTPIIRTRAFAHKNSFCV